jgi:hypothetical protein
MIETEATIIVDKVIKIHWPTWKFTPEAEGEWARRLIYFDYTKSKKLLTDLAFTWDRQGHPPTGKLFALLKTHAALPREKKESEPVRLYDICKVGNSRGYKFAWPYAPTQDEMKAIKASADIKVSRMNEALEEAERSTRYYINWKYEGFSDMM